MTYPAQQESKVMEKASPINDEEEYEAPSLIEYGQVAELTQGTGSMNADMVANRRKN